MYMILMHVYVRTPRYYDAVGLGGETIPLGLEGLEGCL